MNVFKLRQLRIWKCTWLCTIQNRNVWFWYILMLNYISINVFFIVDMYYLWHTLRPLSLTISIAVYVKTITHSSHSLKLEFMMTVSWSLTGFVFVIPCMTATGAAGDHRLLYHFRKCCTFKKQTIILFSSFGFTFITPPYTYEFPYPTWVHIQLRWFNAEET